MKILITGGAGFIGSHIVDALMQRDDVSEVCVYDNLITGNLDNIQHHFDNPKFTFVEGDILDRELLGTHMKGVTKVCHQAALGSVPRSVENPYNTHQTNVTGTFNVFDLARIHGVERVVFASSSSVYGNHPGLPKNESETGEVLSPYALTKKNNEDYARIFFNQYNLKTIGLRYFNIFGPRQNPQGQYAAVIPLFVKAAIDNRTPVIYGDGLQSRDFTYVANAVQANILALFDAKNPAFGKAINIACNERKSLIELWNVIREETGCQLEPRHIEERKGDVKHSLASIEIAKENLAYQVLIDFSKGIQQTIQGYKND